jgi:hypothetical protein
MTAARHIRNWCIEHGVGRRVGGGQWVVSKVALAMFLDGDDVVLTPHKEGNRSNNCVVHPTQKRRAGRAARESRKPCAIWNPAANLILKVEAL